MKDFIKRKVGVLAVSPHGKYWSVFVMYVNVVQWSVIEVPFHALSREFLKFVSAFEWRRSQFGALSLGINQTVLTEKQWDGELVLCWPHVIGLFLVFVCECIYVFICWEGEWNLLISTQDGCCMRFMPDD